MSAGEWLALGLFVAVALAVVGIACVAAAADDGEDRA